jgi:hypothetical protein
LGFFRFGADTAARFMGFVAAAARRFSLIRTAFVYSFGNVARPLSSTMML